MSTNQTPRYMTRRLLVTIRDSAGVPMDSFERTLTLKPEEGMEPEYPADRTTAAELLAKIAHDLEVHVAEGLACRVDIEPLCTFPGCDGPAGASPTLCDPCAHATL